LQRAVADPAREGAGCCRHRDGCLYRRSSAAKPDLFKHDLAGQTTRFKFREVIAFAGSRELRIKSLKPLGHIFDFATFRIKCG
jgi:hypothetical protein